MFTLDDFSGSIGKDFEVSAGDMPVPLRLAVAEAMPHGIREGGAFRLEFAGPEQPILPQAVYTMREGGREMELFIVPVASGPQGTQYEAIFS